MPKKVVKNKLIWRIDHRYLKIKRFLISNCQKLIKHIRTGYKRHKKLWIILGLIVMLLIAWYSNVIAARNARVEMINRLKIEKQQGIELFKKLEKDHDTTKSELEQQRQKNQQLQAEIRRLEARKRANAVYAASEPVNTPQVPSGSCQDWMKQAGITDTANAYALIMRESGCNPNAVNPYSGACGLSQSLPCNKMGPVNPDGTSAVSPVNQLIWMNNYVHSRYGGWSKAWAFWQANNWY